MNPKLIHLIKIINKHNVEYVVVGGTAVGFYGFQRLSQRPDGQYLTKPDIDIFYNPTIENYYNLLRVIEELGLETKDYFEEIQPNPRNSFFKFETSDFYLDFNPELKCQKKFNEIYPNKVDFNYQGLIIAVISKDDLILDKSINPRPKDIIDIEELKKL